jgi:hypothetical protein
VLHITLRPANPEVQAVKRPSAQRPNPDITTYAPKPPAPGSCPGHTCITICSKCVHLDMDEPAVQASKACDFEACSCRRQLAAPTLRALWPATVLVEALPQELSRVKPVVGTQLVRVPPGVDDTALHSKPAPIRECVKEGWQHEATACCAAGMPATTRHCRIECVVLRPRPSAAVRRAVAYTAVHHMPCARACACDVQGSTTLAM